MIEKEFIHQLYIENYNTLARIARNLGKSWMDAEDLVQDVFVIAAHKCPELMKHKNPRAWLVTTLHNLIKNNNRLYTNKLSVSLEDLGDLAAPERAEPLSHVLPSQLPAGDKEILIWKYEKKMDYREMSETLGISEAACRVKVHRILKKYRRLMEE